MSSFNKYKYVFQPIRVGNMTVKNRIQFSPMVSSLSTPTGGVSSELLGYVKMQARTGVGVITIGSTPIDHVNGVDFFGALDVTSDDQHNRPAPPQRGRAPLRRQALRRAGARRALGPEAVQDRPGHRPDRHPRRGRRERHTRDDRGGHADHNPRVLRRVRAPAEGQLRHGNGARGARQPAGTVPLPQIQPPHRLLRRLL